MKIPFPNKQKLSEVESLLQSVLQPVKPHPEFIGQLRNRLVDYSRPTITRSKVNRIQLLLVILASLAGSALLAFTGLRALLAFLGAIGLIRYVKHQAEQKSLSTPRPVL